MPGSFGPILYHKSALQGAGLQWTAAHGVQTLVSPSSSTAPRETANFRPMKSTIVVWPTALATTREKSCFIRARAPQSGLAHILNAPSFKSVTVNYPLQIFEKYSVCSSAIF